MSAPIPIALVGCDFRRATSHQRSALVLDDGEARSLGEELRRAGAADGLVELATCNRSEWIVATEHPEWAGQLLKAWMLTRLGERADGSVEPYTHLGDAAARHLFSVVLGRESLVVGERQIAGQFFAALERARQRGDSTRVLNGLGAVAGRLLRNADRDGLLGARTRGVHVLGVELVRSRLAGRAHPRVAVVGLGAIGRRVQALVEAEPGWSAVLCNRTLPEDGDVRPLTDLGPVLAEVDAAVVCTGAPEPTVRAEHVARRTAGPPLLLVDLGIPEQVAGDLPGSAERKGLDDLCQCRTEVPAHDAEAVDLIGRALEELRHFCREPRVRDALVEVRRRHKLLVGEELPRLVAERCAELPEPLRGRLVHDLSAALGGYTHDLLRIVRQQGAEP